jgi:hypothetical protein
MESPDRPRPRSRLFATIIGVDVYDRPDFAPLGGAARDARLVFDALGRTRLAGTQVVGRLLISGGEVEPTRAAIVEALRQVAAEAGQADTVLIHFAGHGVIVGGQVALAPRDGRLSEPDSLLSLAAIQDLFEQSRCPRRAMLLDACQEVIASGAAAPAECAPARGAAADVAGADACAECAADALAADVPSPVGVAGAARGAGGYRTRGTVSSGFVDALRVDRSGWVLVTSCGPGELSLESDELNRHGIFSYHVALGLRGEADLDRDGTVGLGELVQYLSTSVPWEARRASAGFLTQTPHLVCRGHVAPFTDEGAAGGDAAPVHERKFAPPPGLARAWLGALGGAWPFEPVTAWRWLILGGGVLYGLLMGLEVVHFAGFVRGAAAGGDDWLTAGAHWLAGGAVAAASLALWLLAMALAQAAVTLRYHHAGYIDGMALLLWHVAVFAGAAAAWRAAADADAGHLVRFGAAMFIYICVMVVFGFNAVHTLLSVLDLERRKEEAVLRDFFREFERRLHRAELPSALACETFHPRIYLALWIAATAVLLPLMAATLLKGRMTPADGLALLRAVVLWVLVSWFVSGYNATYRQLLRKHPKQVKA